jgi:tetratricopeptide (TPR) repeat protein
MTVRHPFFLAVVSLFVTGCATGRLISVPTTEEIPGLEAEYERNPGDLELGILLGMAYREAGRQADARAIVTPLLAAVPRDPGLLVLSGLLAEDAGDWASARATYDSLLETTPSGALRQRVEQRLRVVRSEELRASVRDALAREAQVAQTTPDPSTVGVFPFVYEGDDPTWEPLAFALPQLLATDLAVTGRLTVLERVHIQALIQELQLAESGRVDPATAARGGRLLGSGHIVQARFGVDSGETIGIDAAVVEVGAPGAEQIDPVTGSDLLDRLFEMEKQLVFDIYAELGIQLTQAEREAINERQTESILALLAFGRGLAAADAGDFEVAEEQFAEAESIDPTFSQATTQREEVQAAQAVATQPTIELTSAAQQVSMQQQAVQQITQPQTIVPQPVPTDVAQHERSVISEVLGQDRIGQVILLELIFRGPGG